MLASPRIVTRVLHTDLPFSSNMKASKHPLPPAMKAGTLERTKKVLNYIERCAPTVKILPMSKYSQLMLL